MICLKCDICGNTFDFGEKIPNHIRFARFTSTGCCNKNDYDICPDCYNSIKKVIDDRRRIKTCSD